MDTIRVEQRVAAPLDALWRACTEPESIARWQADAVGGNVVAGGRLRLSWPSLNVRIALDVVEVIREKRVVLRSGSSWVELEFEEGAVTLTHGGLAPGDEAEGTESSWRLALAQLAHYLNRHRGQRRRVHWAVQPMRIEAESAHAFFTEGAALAAWLMHPKHSSSIGAAGSRFHSRFSWGPPIHGSVLCNTKGRDIAVTWEDDGDSVLAMRTVPAPENKQERLTMLTWSRWGSAGEPAPLAERNHVTGFGLALGRLARLVDSAGRA